MNNNEEVLNIVYKICDCLEFEVNNKGIVTVLDKQDHKIQNLLRKVKVNISQYKKLNLMNIVVQYVY